MSAQMNEKAHVDATYGGLANTPYTETDMYKTTLPSILEMMPEDVKNGLRAVKKKNTIDGVKTAYFETADKVWLFSEAEVGGGWNNPSDGVKYNYGFWNCANENGNTDAVFFLRSYSGANYFTIYMSDFAASSGYVSDAAQIDTFPVIFGFCF
jgi:hypothetical protein